MTDNILPAKSPFFLAIHLDGADKMLTTATGWRTVVLVAVLVMLSGCSSVPKEDRDPRDPWEGFNRSMYGFNDAIDKAILKPVAQGYDAILPTPVNNSVTNFFDNIDDVPVSVNSLLQGKPQNAASDISRFVFNSTFGIFGLFDFAGRFLDLPKRNEDFGQTLGVWGVPPGPYLVLPVLGPRTTRGAFGLIVDLYLDPLFHVREGTTSWALVITRFIDTRAGLLAAERVLDTAALDPYIFIREAYLQQRRNLVYDGNPPPGEFEDELFGDDFEDDPFEEDPFEEDPFDELNEEDPFDVPEEDVQAPPTSDSQET